MRKATKLVFSLFVVGLTLSLTTGLRAQETAKEDWIHPITKGGSAAFMFTLNGLGDFKIGAPMINGLTGGLGAKWFVADDIAIRLSLGLSSVQTPATITFNGVTMTNPQDTAHTVTASTIGIGVGGEYHFRPLYSTSPYVGLQIGYTSTSQDSIAVPGTGTDIEGAKFTSFGVGAFAGFDWFFTRGIAIGAEMGLGFISNGGTKLDGASAPSRSTIMIATNGSAHIVVYF